MATATAVDGREAIAGEERYAALLGELANREVSKAQLPVNPGPAGSVLAGDRERIVRSVGLDPNLQQRVEAIALENLGPVNGGPTDGIWVKNPKVSAPSRNRANIDDFTDRSHKAILYNDAQTPLLASSSKSRRELDIPPAPESRSGPGRHGHCR